MKKWYMAIAFLLLFSLVATAVLLVISPDIIPAHYNAAGEVDRFGSKYEQLIFPGFGLLMTGTLLMVLRFEKKRGMQEADQKILLAMVVFSLLLFTGLELFFGIIAIRDDQGGQALEPGVLVKMMSISTGTLLILLGNIMPKARRNSFFGLRTGWSMKNDRVWQRSQRFGGISAVVCGLATVLQAVVLPGAWNIWVTLGLLLVWTVLGVFMSWRYCQQDGK